MVILDPCATLALPLRYVAMILCVLMLGVGNVWAQGAEDILQVTPSAGVHADTTLALPTTATDTDCTPDRHALLMKDIILYACMALLLLFSAVLFILDCIAASRRPQAATADKFRAYDRRMRIIAVLALLMVSLLADNLWCYILMIIIVATLLTDLHFPLTLMALLTKNKDYFEYLSQTEVRSKVLGKIETDVPDSTQEDGDTPKGRSSFLQRPNNDMTITPTRSREHYIQLEQLALDHAEREFDCPVERNVRLRGRRDIEFDGIIRQEETDIVLEIRYGIRNIKDTLRRVLKNVAVYMQLTGRKAELQVMVVQSEDDNETEYQDLVENLYGSASPVIDGIKMQFVFLDEYELQTEQTETDETN